MLINFTFGNFRSFREEKTLDMEATSITEHKDSLIRVGNRSYLPLAVVYGANSSGKSNLIKAFGLFLYLVKGSHKLDPDDTIRHKPFLLDENSMNECSSFEIQFTEDSTKYRYGFEYNQTKISGEWLFEQTIDDKEEICLFDRECSEEETTVDIGGRFFDAGELSNSLNDNQLFLSFVANRKKKTQASEQAKKIVNSLRKINIINGEKDEDYKGYTIGMFKEHDNGFVEASNFLSKMDLGFKEYFIEEVNSEYILELIVKEVGKKHQKEIQKILEKKAKEEKDSVIIREKTKHNIYNKKGEIIKELAFEEDEMESMGTQKVISLSGPLFDTLLNGKTLIVDELDAKLHPFLTRAIVKLFTNKEINKFGAQLIFATHDTNLLDLDLLRRDEIWFTEKDKYESTDLYSLAEFKGVNIRKDTRVERNYINGRYGAIPFIN